MFKMYNKSTTSLVNFITLFILSQNILFEYSIIIFYDDLFHYILFPSTVIKSHMQ